MVCILPHQDSCEMAATKLTAFSLLSTEETHPAYEDTRMETDIPYEDEDALLSEDRSEDAGLNMSIFQMLKDRSVSGIQQMS